MCYSCSLVQEFPERGPGPAGVTEREEEEGGELVKRLLGDFRCTVCTVI